MAIGPTSSGAPPPDPRGEGMVAGALLLSTAASVGLGIVYWRGGQVQLEGTLLAVALGGLAVALAVWSKRFMPQGPFTEERPVLASSEADRSDFVADLERAERTLTRRSALLKLGGLAAAALGAVALFPFRSLGSPPLRALRRTRWRRGVRVVDDRGRPVHRDDLVAGNVVTVFPEGIDRDGRADSQTVLIRLRPGELRVRPGRETWSPDDYVAFSKVCTHAGCPVGLYEAETHRLVCPCHQSLFDVTEAARPVYGPATRSLPQLPLAIDADGFLTAQSDYTEPIGPGFWSFPS